MATTVTGKVNGVDVDVLGKTVEAIRQDPELGRARFHVRNRWTGGSQNCSTVSDFFVAKQDHMHKQPFELAADEPPLLAGEDAGANPVEHLLHALASCVTTSMIAHAAVRGIHIQEVESHVEGDIDLRGFLGLADVPKGYTSLRMHFKIKADGVDLAQLKRLAEFSPVYNTLAKCVPIELVLEPKT